MAKLYWRVKRDGKWTWQAANVKFSKTNDVTHNLWVEIVVDDQEMVV
jgi:hypothetical protein